MILHSCTEIKYIAELQCNTTFYKKSYRFLCIHDFHKLYLITFDVTDLDLYTCSTINI